MVFVQSCEVSTISMITCYVPHVEDIVPSSFLSSNDSLAYADSVGGRLATGTRGAATAARWPLPVSARLRSVYLLPGALA